MTPHLVDTPVLTTQRLTLRAPSAQDADVFVAFYGTDRSKHAGGPMAPRQAWNFFCTEIGHWAMLGFGMFSVTRKGEDRAIGLVGHWCPVDWPEKEIGWVILDPAAEGQGIAHEAALACVDHAFGPLGWTTAVSYIDPRNDRSVALAERLGAAVDETAQPPVRRDPANPAALVYRHSAPQVLQ